MLKNSKLNKLIHFEINYIKSLDRSLFIYQSCATMLVKFIETGCKN